MRVHPAILAPRLSKLHYMGLIGILSLILVVTMIRGPRKVVMQAAPVVPTAEVVVSSVGLETGDPLYENHLQVKTMPIDMIPDGAIRTLSDSRGKFSNGLVPAGVPLLNNMLSDSRPELPNKSDGVVNPAMTPLDRIRASTVAVSLVFRGAPPREATRVALSVTAANGTNVIVVDDAWIDSADSRGATVRLNPDQALVVQAAKELGAFSFIELPTEGNSPYRGVAAQNLADLKEKLGMVTKSEGESTHNDGLNIGLLHKQEEKKRFKNYAWVTGTGVRLGIADNGRLHQVDVEGYDLGELPPARMGE